MFMTHNQVVAGSSRAFRAHEFCNGASDPVLAIIDNYYDAKNEETL